MDILDPSSSTAHEPGRKPSNSSVLAAGNSKRPDFMSWDFIGWWVAILVGVWGVLVGIGLYYWSDVAFFFAIACACGKWGHFTKIHTRDRHLLSFVVGMVVALASSSVVMLWSRRQQHAADKRDQQLAQLSRLPALDAQVERIPELQKQVVDLRVKINEDTQGLNGKEDTIRQLASITLSQQKTIASDAQRDLASTAIALHQSIERQGASLASNMDLLRADTSAAIAAGTSPDRRLSAQQTSALSTAISEQSCDKEDWKGLSDLSGWVSVVWVSGEESAGYASDFVNAFGGMNSNGSGTCGRFSFATEFSPKGRLKGTILAAPDWNKPSKMALLIRSAFDGTHIPYVPLSMAQAPILGAKAYGVSIVIGAK